MQKVCTMFIQLSCCFVYSTLECSNKCQIFLLNLSISDSFYFQRTNQRNKTKKEIQKNFFGKDKNRSGGNRNLKETAKAGGGKEKETKIKINRRVYGK